MSTAETKTETPAISREDADAANTVTRLPSGDTDFAKYAVYKASRTGPYPDPDKSRNYNAFMTYHHAFRDIFAWDEFSLAPIMVKCPDWYPEEIKRTFKVHKIGGEDIILFDYELQVYGMNGSIDKTKHAVSIAAKRNPVHPARDYFNSLVWDGIPRLDTWLTRYCSAVDDDPEYLAAVGRKWMTAAVARVMEPGCKFDNMLIFEGPQGVGKSTTFRVLATFGDEGDEHEYFTDQLILANADNKDELQKLAGVLICEIGEMDGFHKRENTFLKAFISRQHDQYRVAYGISVESYPRQFVFAGSYNPAGGIITDPTGARRYWFVKNGAVFDIVALRRDKNQLWAEAVVRYRDGEKLYLDDKLSELAADAADKRRIVDEWTNDVMNVVGTSDFVEVATIMKSLGFEITSRNGPESRRISNILRAAGWEYVRRVRNRKQVHGWINPKSPWYKPKPDETELPLVSPQPAAKDYDEVEF
jgi:predicted P-loop ATPase